MKNLLLDKIKDHVQDIRHSIVDLEHQTEDTITLHELANNMYYYINRIGMLIERLEPYIDEKSEGKNDYL